MGLVTKQKSELIQLLKDAQERDGRPWEVIAVLAGVRSKTIEGWTSGAVKTPGLQPFHRVMNVLGVDAKKIAEAIERDYALSAPEYLRDLRDLRHGLDTREGSSETGSEDRAGPGAP